MLNNGLIVQFGTFQIYRATNTWHSDITFQLPTTYKKVNYAVVTSDCAIHDGNHGTSIVCRSISVSNFVYATYNNDNYTLYYVSLGC